MKIEKEEQEGGRLIRLMLATALTFFACSKEDSCTFFGKCDDDEEEFHACGSSIYIPKSQGCCDNSSVYSLASQRCENNVVEAKCGGNWYVPSASSYCVNGTLTAAKGEFTDARDGKTYKYVTIGTQNWMAENLNYEAEGSTCYENDPANCEKYGRLYDWETAMNACPDGWHLSGHDEWTTLEDAVGGYSIAGVRLKAASGWKNVGTDEYGWAALPAGKRTYGNNNYGTIGSFGYCWSAIEFSPVPYRVINNDNDVHSPSIVGYSHWSQIKDDQHSVRCIQGAPAPIPPPPALPPPVSESDFGTLTDSRDGKTYRTVKIGSQVWMAENLNYHDEGLKQYQKCYEGKDENCAKCGMLYDGDNARGYCPAGWHLPTQAEWEKLLQYADGTNGRVIPYYSPAAWLSPYVSQMAGKHLKAKEGWNDYKGQSGNGTDRYGFAALPCGWGHFVGHSSEEFIGAGGISYWWILGSANGPTYSMGGSHDGVDWSGRGGAMFTNSVRCVKN